MENENEEDSSADRSLQSLLDSFSKAQVDYKTDKAERTKLTIDNATLLQEICKLKETNKQDQQSILSSREIIAKLQESVSSLVHLKREMKKLNIEMKQKDIYIEMAKQDQQELVKQHQEKINDLKREQNQLLKELRSSCDSKMARAQLASDTRLGQPSGELDELAATLAQLHTDHHEKINLLVMDYEQRIQSAEGEASEVRDACAALEARADAEVQVYRTRIHELEGLLKQSEFKKFLAASNLESEGCSEDALAAPSHSGARDPWDTRDTRDTWDSRDRESWKPQPSGARAAAAAAVVPPRAVAAATAAATQVKRPDTSGTMYCDNIAPTVKAQDKRGPFHITKKRKLYTEKNFI